MFQDIISNAEDHGEEFYTPFPDNGGFYKQEFSNCIIKASSFEEAAYKVYNNRMLIYNTEWMMGEEMIDDVYCEMNAVITGNPSCLLKAANVSTYNEMVEDGLIETESHSGCDVTIELEPIVRCMIDSIYEGLDGNGISLNLIGHDF